MKNFEQSNSENLKSKFENHPTNFSVFCQQMLSLQRARLMLASKTKGRTLQITVVLFLLIDSPQKQRLGKINGILITHFNVRLISL